MATSTRCSRATSSSLDQSKGIHVVPHDHEGWLVRRENQDEPIGTYATEAEAQEAGRKVFHEDEVELTIHGQGHIRGEAQLRARPPQHLGTTAQRRRRTGTTVAASATRVTANANATGRDEPTCRPSTISTSISGNVTPP